MGHDTGIIGKLKRPAGLFLLVLGLIGAAGSQADTAALSTLCMESSGRATTCSVPSIEDARNGDNASPATRRLLRLSGENAGARTLAGPGRTRIRYAHPSIAALRSSDAVRIETTVRSALENMHGLLVERLGLPAPNVDVELATLFGDLDGYLLPSGGTTRIVVQVGPTFDVNRVVRTTHHLYARAIGAALPEDWSEALAIWARRHISTDDPIALSELDRRIRALSRGLLTPDALGSSGNPAWLAFLGEAYGFDAVRATLAELAGTDTTGYAALDRALRHSENIDLESAFRDFHLWTQFLGARSDGRHFSFASRLRSPMFASAARGLPALSVRADAPLAEFGATQVLLRPDTDRGGLRLDFDGDLAARWSVDLLLISTNGDRHRLPLDLEGGTRAEHTIPLQGLAEAVLLIRNLESFDGSDHRYTYAAQYERDYPMSLASLDATAIGAGAAVSWETSSEFGLVGFNVLRYHADDPDAGPERINPVWIPAMGGGGRLTAYSFWDGEAQPGDAYTYRIQAVTRDGLTTSSALEASLPID